MRGDHSAPWSITSSKSRQIESSWAGTARYCMWASASRTRASDPRRTKHPPSLTCEPSGRQHRALECALGDSCIDRCDQQLEVTRDRERQQIGVAAGRNPAATRSGRIRTLSRRVARLCDGRMPTTSHESETVTPSASRSTKPNTRVGFSGSVSSRPCVMRRVQTGDSDVKILVPVSRYDRRLAALPSSSSPAAPSHSRAR